MEITSVTPLCFSPTGTTKTAVQAIARGFNSGTADVLDITRPDARKQSLRTGERDLLIVGMPVYLGRIPAVAGEWLRTLQAQDTPAVCVIVYGNRAYDDALIELADILRDRGCRPVAGAAFIGQHSFSTDTTPTAEGRPDARDREQAAVFGQKIYRKLREFSSPCRVPDMQFPGVHPYRMETCQKARRSGTLISSRSAMRAPSAEPVPGDARWARSIQRTPGQSIRNAALRAAPAYGTAPNMQRRSSPAL